MARLFRSLLPRVGVIAVAILASGSALGQSRPEIEYVYPEQSVWTTKLDERGEPVNPLFPIAAELFSQAGIPWHARGYPAARMFEALQSGKANFSMLVKAPVLEGCCLISRRPVANTELRVYHLADRPPVHGREDLKGKDTITILGYSYGGLLTFLNTPANRIVNNVAASHHAAFVMLERGRANYLIDYLGPASEVLAEHPIAGVTSELLTQLEVFMVLSRAYPDAQGVLARLEAIADSRPK